MGSVLRISWKHALNGNCHDQFDSRRQRCKAKPPAYDGPFAAKEITPDKRADPVNEKWPENLACCHKRIYLNACAAHGSFPLKVCVLRRAEYDIYLASVSSKGRQKQVHGNSVIYNNISAVHQSFSTNFDSYFNIFKKIYFNTIIFSSDNKQFKFPTQ